MGLLSAIQVVRVAPRTARPSTVMRCAPGSKLLPIVAGSPSTRTRPARIKSSALRRDATPARAMARCRRIRVIRVRRRGLGAGGPPTAPRAAAGPPDPSVRESPGTRGWCRRAAAGLLPVLPRRRAPPPPRDPDRLPAMLAALGPPTLLEPPGEGTLPRLGL